MSSSGPPSSSSSGPGQRKRRREQSKEPTSNADSIASGLISLNGLSYALASDLSVVTSRQVVEHNFQQATYTAGQRAICILNSGAAFLDPMTTSLAFTITNKGGEELSMDKGSAIDWLSRLTITTRDGLEAERITRCNMLAAHRMRYERSVQWLDTVGGMFGATGSGSATTIAVNGSARFIVPLSVVSGLFQTKQLLPSFLCSGLRFSLELAPASEAFKWLSLGGSHKYEINNMTVVCDQYTLTDAIQRELSQQASISGLEIPYVSSFHVESAVIDTSVTVHVRKACSRALNVIT